MIQRCRECNIVRGGLVSDEIPDTWPEPELCPKCAAKGTPDFDERMTTINSDESGDNRLDVYINLSTIKGYKPKEDKEAHIDLRFVHTCGTFEIVDMSLSSLRALIGLLTDARKDWKNMELKDSN